MRFSVRSWFTLSGSPVTYSARSLHETVASVDDEMCGSMLTVTARSQGTASIAVTASANGVTETDTLTVEVDPNASFVGSTTNSAPVAEGTIADTTFTQVTSSISFFVSPYFSDPDGNSLTYSPGLSPTGMVEASITDSTLTLTARMKGTATVTVTARDPGGLEVTQSFRATIANSPPVPEGTISDTTFTCKTSPVSFVVSPYFRDPDPKDKNTLTYSPSSSNTGVVTTSVTDSTLTLTAVSKESATVTVTATDRSGANATQVFRATIANSVPEAKGTIPAMTVAVGASLVFDVSEYFEDCDSQDMLRYLGVSLNRDLASASMSGSTLTITGLSAGIARMVAFAYETPTTEIPRQYFNVTVVEGNRPPIPVGTIPDTTLTLGGSSVSFDVSDYFEDPDEDELTYTVSGPSIVTTTIPEDDSTLTITPVSVGTGTVTVTATDPSDADTTQVFTVEVSSTLPLSVSIASGPMTTIASGAENTWEAEATGGVPTYTYHWDYATRCIDGSLIRAPDDEPCVWQWIGAGSESSTLMRTITTDSSYAGVRVRATDSAMPTPSSVMDSVIVSVNHAPDTVGAIVDRTLILGHPDVSFDVARFFSDPDGNSLTYEPSSSSDDTVGVSISGSTLTLTAEAVNTTAETVTVTATDPGGLSSPAQEFAVTVEDTPTGLTVFITGDNLTSIESGTEYTWGSTVTGGTPSYTYSWHYATQCVNDDLIRAEPCTLQWTSEGTGSSYTRAITTTGDRAHIRLIVSDSANPQASVTKSLQLTVTQPPAGLTAVGTISDRTLTVGGSSSSFSVSSYFRGPNVDDILTYSASSSNTSRVTESMSGATLTIRPVAAGTATITVTASLDGESAEQSFNVTVNSSTIVPPPPPPPPPPNNSPVVDDDIANQTLTAGGSSVTFDLDDYFSDPDPNDDLTYSASSSNTSRVTTSVSGSTLTIRPVAKGGATVTVTADDGEDDVSQSVMVTVNSSTIVQPPPNRSPVVDDDIADQTLTAGGSSVTFDLDDYFSDPDPNDDLDYSASSSNTSVASAGVSGSTLTITPLAKGSATVTVTADDGEDDVSQTVTVTIPNRGPIPGAMPARKLTLVTSPSTSFGVSSYFSDPDGDNLTYSASSSSTSRVTTSMSGATLTITAVATGAATVTVTARDPDGATATPSFNVTVLPRPNRIPVVDDDIPDQTLTAGGSAVTFDLSDYFSDPDDDNLIYSAWSSNSSVARGSRSGSTLTITPVSAGSATITVVARDPSQAGAIQSVGVTVSTAAGLSASISGSSSISVLEIFDSHTWTASASGGTTPYTYSWRYTRLCSNQGPGDRAAPPCTEWVSGGTASTLSLTLSASTTLELTVTDADEDSVTATLSVSYPNP